MTWKDVKLATLQKMFAAEGNTIPTDESTTDYLAGMPHVANEALQRLSTAGKFITKSIVIAHIPLANLLQADDGLRLYPLGTQVFTMDGVGSYYFEFSGKGVLTIEREDGITEEVVLESKGTYTEYRGTFDIPLGVKFTFACTYPSTVKNVAFYAEVFDEAEEIPAYAQMVKYQLKKLCSDFFQLRDNSIYYEGISGEGYIQTSRYYRESENVLVLRRDEPGSYTVYYKAYPPVITASTEDDYELPLDREVAILLPLYMASQLYKDDDNGIATSYRNEFEAGLESLIDTSGASGYEEFTSERGWV